MKCREGTTNLPEFSLIEFYREPHTLDNKILLSFKLFVVSFHEVPDHGAGCFLHCFADKLSLG